MKKLTEQQALTLLKNHAPNSKAYQTLLQHSKAVQKVSLVIAQAIQKQGHKVNLNLIKTASLLHDIGKFKLPPKSKDSFQDGIIGGKLLRKEGLPQHARIAETHLGAGLTKQQIIKLKLPLPKKDFLPKTIEEKIIAYVDNIIIEDRLASISEITAKLKKEIPWSLPQLIKLHNEIEKLRGGLQTL